VLGVGLPLLQHLDPQVEVDRRAEQRLDYDTAVARDHRGHRLGVALTIDMMRWLAEAEPQLEGVTTWNNVDNTPMINVNEALGHRLSRTFAMFHQLAPGS